MNGSSVVSCDAAREDPATASPLAPSRSELELMLTTAQRLAHLGSWTWDARSDRFSWSDETLRVIHLSPRDFDGTMEGFVQQVHPEDRTPLREAVQAALAGTPLFNYRYRLRGRDGRERLIAGEGEAQFDADGAPLRLIGTVMDITERERERESLRESEERFRHLVALSSDWYWEQDAELRFTRITGGPTATPDRQALIVGRRRWDIPGLTPVGSSWDEHRADLAARRPFRELELRVGEWPDAYYVSIAGEPFFDAHGTFLGYRGTARDITRRKSMEERLREVNASLWMAMRLGRIGVWSLDLATRAIDWWSGGRVVYGVDGAMAGGLDALLERVEPAFRAELREAIGNCAAHGASFDLEVPLAAGVLPLMWARLIGEPHRDAHGDIRQVRGTVQDVTERRLAAERARELGSRLAVTLDSVTDSFVTVNRDWAISYLNPEAERLVRRSRAELIGRNLWAEFPRLAGSRFEREYRRALAEGRTVEFEEFFEPFRMWLQVKAYPSPQGLAIYFRDITDGRSIQDALADSQEQLRQLFENTIDGVLYKAVDGEVFRVNPAACAILGRPEPEVRGRRFAEFVAPGGFALKAFAEQRAMTGRASAQLTLVRGDGSAFPAEVSSAEYTAADGSARAFVVIRDISRRVHGEQQILRLNAELGERVRQRTAELEAANAELKAFAHSLAHDLRSPAAAIDGYAALLEGVLPVPVPPRAAHYLARIRAAVRKSTEYTEGLLSLARVSQAKLEIADVDLSAIARDVLTQLAERDAGRQVAWTVQPGLKASGDRTLLRMALENLLGNAWKFTGRQPQARIVFAADTAADGTVTFRVEDNGAGFDMAYADKLFGSFERLHAQEDFPGTGIGLANVQRIVVRHGGTIRAEAREGQGARFSFTLGLGAASRG